MAANKEEIAKWLDDAKSSGATHLIMVCDTFDWGDYPVKVMEVYNLGMDIEKQLLEHRSLNF